MQENHPLPALSICIYIIWGERMKWVSAFIWWSMTSECELLNFIKFSEQLEKAFQFLKMKKSKGQFYL